MSVTQSETPRTNAGAFTVKDTRIELMRDDRQLVDAFLCRTIERELTDATDQLKNAQAELLKLCLRQQLLHEDYKSEKNRANEAMLELNSVEGIRDCLILARDHFYERYNSEKEKSQRLADALMRLMKAEEATKEEFESPQINELEASMDHAENILKEI
jgi:hypothetical protein